MRPNNFVQADSASWRQLRQRKRATISATTLHGLTQALYAAVTITQLGEEHMPTYKPGDIVKLKSGGPPMTVVKYETNINGQPTGTVRCKWFAGAKLADGGFPEDTLEPVPPAGSKP